MYSLRLSLFILLLFVISGCGDITREQAILKMAKKFPEIYPKEATIRKFKKDTVIYDDVSSTKYQLYLSWHHEHQFVVVSRQGHGAYAVPFPDYNLAYFNYRDIGGNTDGKTLAREFENAGRMLYAKDTQYTERFFKNIFLGLFRAKQLTASDSLYLKSNITRFKNDTARKLIAKNYNRIFNHLAIHPQNHKLYYCIARGEIYEVTYNPEHKPFPYMVIVYWNPLTRD